MRANLNAKVNQNYYVTLNKIKVRVTWKVAVKEISSRSINMLSIMSVMINMNESKLKHKG